MKPFDVFIAFLSWDGGGKNRPVLAFILGESTVDIYKITSKYDNKSEAVQSQYFKINDWEQSGLDKQSYIDTGTLITLPAEAFKNRGAVGRLTENDKHRLYEFLAMD
ncbi:MAG: hypothetical protein LBR85_06260 [Oscillospiraceae bacterium]|nr:hypothetical protein [Oscillospiraceae bacterium]